MTILRFSFPTTLLLLPYHPFSFAGMSAESDKLLSFSISSTPSPLPPPPPPISPLPNHPTSPPSFTTFLSTPPPTSAMVDNDKASPPFFLPLLSSLHEGPQRQHLPRKRRQHQHQPPSHRRRNPNLHHVSHASSPLSTATTMLSLLTVNSSSFASARAPTTSTTKGRSPTTRPPSSSNPPTTYSFSLHNSFDEDDPESNLLNYDLAHLPLLNPAPLLAELYRVLDAFRILPPPPSQFFFSSRLDVENFNGRRG